MPKEASALYAINYNRINKKKIYTDLDRWVVLSLDLGSRVRSIRMNVLPKILYLFTALLVEINTV